MTIYNTFIGYSSEDENSAKYIHDCLNRIVQFQPYMAEIYPSYGEDFKKRLQDELDKSYFMVVLLTNHGIRSQWVNQEVGYACAIKRRLRLSPLLQRLPYIIPISESQAELKGFITKDTTDILFLDKFTSFEDVMANIILAMRKKILRGLEKKVLGHKITCSNCFDRKGLPFEYESLILSHETMHRAIESGQPIFESECPQCHIKNYFYGRTFLPVKGSA